MSLSIQVYGNIVETANINEVTQVVNRLEKEDKRPLVLFNISDVCFEHIYYVQDEAYRKLVTDRVKALLPEDEAKEAINKIRTLIVNRLHQKLIEDITPKVISQLQTQVPVLGISGRSAWAPYAPSGNNADLLNSYLEKLDINFADSDFVREISLDTYQEEGQPSFQHGILFTSGRPSADQVQNAPTSEEVLQKFLEDIQFIGKTLVLVDNSNKSQQFPLKL